MREADEATVQALRGSRAGDELVAWVWYGGELVFDEPLPVSGWRLSWDGDARQTVQGTLSLTVVDADGDLAPWAFADPLGVGGSRIQVFYQVGGADAIPMGWYRIESVSATESWRFTIIKEDRYRDPGSVVPENYREVAVSTGASIPLTGKELTAEVEADRFAAPEQPQGVSPTVRSEVERIIGDAVPLVFTDFTDAPVSKTVVWEESRMEAVMDLLDVAGSSYRMTGAGEMEVYTKDRTPVVVLAGGVDGVLIDVSRSMSLTDLYNVGVVESSVKTGDVEVPIYGYYEITSGPLRSSGPFGRRVIKAQNPLMTSQGRADKAAETMVLNRLSAQRVELGVTCLPDPRIQVGDTVTVANPVVDGRIVPVNGEVVAMELSGGAAVNEMSLTVSCLLSDITAAMRNYRVDKKLTGPGEATTWANINPGRTWAQMRTSWANLEGK